MQLTIDRASNQLVIDGTVVKGTRRWESSVIAALLEGGHHSQAKACTAIELNRLLATHGQQKVLTRKQWSLIWSSIGRMFTEAGAPNALFVRLCHRPRAATVGPWWWDFQPGDEIHLVGKATRVQACSLPALCAVEANDRMASLCEGQLVCQSLLSEGQLDAALEALSDRPTWNAGTPELNAWVQLKSAEIHMLRRDFDQADTALSAVRQLMDKFEVVETYLEPLWRVLGQRIDYARDPIAAHSRILGDLSKQLRLSQFAVAREVDLHARGLSFNLAALCERRWIERNVFSQRNGSVSQHASAAMQCWSAALFCFVLANQHEQVQNVCSNLGYFHQRLFELGVHGDPSLAFRWYSLSQAWQNRFDLPDSSVWEYVFIGDFWLANKLARALFQQANLRGGWSGRHPGSLDFYEYAAARAREIGEPRQLAHTALNLCRFIKEYGSMADFDSARSSLEEALSLHPSLRQLLKAEGYALPETAVLARDVLDDE